MTEREQEEEMNIKYMNIKGGLSRLAQNMHKCNLQFTFLS